MRLLGGEVQDLARGAPPLIRVEGFHQVGGGQGWAVQLRLEATGQFTGDGFHAGEAAGARRGDGFLVTGVRLGVPPPHAGELRLDQ
ncbi:hypothetical protein ACN28S_34615 [Cystobacter fuscus]